jgi:Fe-S-cluster containining protein
VSKRDLDEMLEQAAVRGEVRSAETEADMRQLAAGLRALSQLLVEHGVVSASEIEARIELTQRELEAGARSRTQPVRLNVLPDKLDQPNEEVDCASRFALCRGACCSMEVPLSVADVEEGALRWDISRPYLLRRGDDGRCQHQDRQTFFCGAYETRPAPCRAYSCRGDTRIWRDFDKRIPNEKGITALLEHKMKLPLMLQKLPPTLPPPR